MQTSKPKPDKARKQSVGATMNGGRKVARAKQEHPRPFTSPLLMEVKSGLGSGTSLSAHAQKKQRTNPAAPASGRPAACAASGAAAVSSSRGPVGTDRPSRPPPAVAAATT
eukprot:772188-Prymnesium_polylepis.1